MADPLIEILLGCSRRHDRPMDCSNHCYWLVSCQATWSTRALYTLHHCAFPGKPKERRQQGHLHRPDRAVRIQKVLPAKADLFPASELPQVGIIVITFDLTLIELAVKVLTYALLANDCEERDDQ